MSHERSGGPSCSYSEPRSSTEYGIWESYAEHESALVLVVVVVIVVVVVVVVINCALPLFYNTWPSPELSSSKFCRRGMPIPGSRRGPAAAEQSAMGSWCRKRPLPTRGRRISRVLCYQREVQSGIDDKLRPAHLPIHPRGAAGLIRQLPPAQQTTSEMCRDLR
jgi:hypothetical protein